jgi:hypothetical protein
MNLSRNFSIVDGYTRAKKHQKDNPMVEKTSLQTSVSGWQQVVDRNQDLASSRQRFLAHNDERVEILRKALQNPSERETALQLYPYLTKEEKRKLFEDLVELASVGHSDIELVRKCLLSLSRPWLKPRIEEVAEPILQRGSDEEYRRLLELYRSIDKTLVERLARRAIEHPDRDIQEAGEDFIEYLDRLKKKTHS